MDSTDRQDPSGENVDAPPAGDDAPAPNRWQFGLARLLMWTAVLALWCGGYVSLPSAESFEGFLFNAFWWLATGWFVLAAVFRIVFGPGKKSVFMSGLLGLGWALFASTVHAFSQDLLHGGFFHFFITAPALLLVGCFLGMITNLVFAFIDPVDTKLAGKRK